MQLLMMYCFRISHSSPGITPTTGETPALSLGMMLTSGKKPNVTPFLGCLRTTCHKVKSLRSNNLQHIFSNITILNNKWVERNSFMNLIHYLQLPWQRGHQAVRVCPEAAGISHELLPQTAQAFLVDIECGKSPQCLGSA